MTNRTKGWLMLSPLILSYVAWLTYTFGWGAVLILLLIPLFVFYVIKAVDLMSSDRNRN